MSDIDIYGFGLPERELPSFEVIDYLEKRMREKSLEYEAALRQKDETIKKLNERIIELERFIEELKAEQSRSQDEILSQNRKLVVEIEESKNILIKQKDKHQKEINLLKGIFERTKRDIDELSKEISQLKEERKLLKQQNSRLAVEKQAIESKLSMIESQLSDAKKAVENTVSELFAERKKVNDISARLNESIKENEELKKQIESIKSAWDSERQQWKEMWERERSMWESHRMEFAVWEERLRNEREAWLKILKDEESKGVENVRKLAEVLEESSKWSYKVGELLKLYANKEIVLPHILTSLDGVKKKVESRMKRIFAFSLLGVFLLTSIGYISYDYSRKIHLSMISSSTLESNSYTSFVKNEGFYFFTDPSKGIVVKDENLKNIDLISEISSQKIKPAVISREGDYLWFFDLSSVRFIKFDPETRTMITSVRSLTYAPGGLSSDGNFLWCFDGIGKVLQRYEINSEIKAVKTYELDGIKSVDGIFWMNDNLIVLSHSRLYRFKFDNDRFVKKSVQKVKNFVYCYLYSDELYVLKDMVSSKRIEVYKIKNRERL